jgi:hypothetical protein
VNILRLDIDEQEKELLLEALKSHHSSLLDEVLHTESYDFRQQLKQKDERLKALIAKVEAAISGSRTI